MKSLVVVRQAMATLLYPVQMVAVMPRDAARQIGDYFASTARLEKENAALKRAQVENAQDVQRSAQLRGENAHLRQLVDAKAQLPVKSILGEILYDAHDPFTRKIILDKGLKHGVALSQPVIDELGVVGQVTRVFPLTSEVTLLTDKNQAIPVQIVRNGLRSVVYGRGQSSYLDMRITANADVKNGDMLVTSGIDGVYPAGLQVAKVVQVENKASTTFENVLCSPMAGIDKNKQLLILLVETDQLPRPDTEEVRAKKEKLNRRVTRDNVLDAGKESANGRAPNAEQKVADAPASATLATPASSPAARSVDSKLSAPASAANSAAPTARPPSAATERR